MVHGHCLIAFTFFKENNKYNTTKSAKCIDILRFDVYNN